MTGLHLCVLQLDQVHARYEHFVVFNTLHVKSNYFARYRTINI